MKRFESRIFWAICAAASLLFATRILADENTGNWFESLGHIPTEYIVEDTYVGDGDVQRHQVRVDLENVLRFRFGRKHAAGALFLRGIVLGKNWK